MKAAAWHGRQDVRVEEVNDPPPPPPGQVQVAVAWCGICGTDLHEYMGGPIYIPVDTPHPLTGVRAPVITGHEMSGRVVAVGEDVTQFTVGDRVVACPIVGCLECRWCKSGSMAQCDKVAFMGTSWTGGALSERLNLRTPMIACSWWRVLANVGMCVLVPDGAANRRNVGGGLW